MRRLLTLVCSLGLVLACASEGDSETRTLQSVKSWRCCAADGCRCREQTPNSGMFCSPEVDSCQAPDGGAGCCVAAFVGSTWECDCNVAGAECPVPGEGCLGDCAVSHVQSVASCPP